MVNLNRSLLVGFFLGLANPVLAEREVHVVAVGDGFETDDYYALPEARVLVNRPGRDIGLVLLDDGELHWKVEATPGTVISEIVRGGPGPEDSKISLFGIPMVGVQVSDLPLVFRPRGRDFRVLLDRLADRMGTDRISSFHGAHKTDGEPLTVDHVDTTTAGLARDYLSKELAPSEDLPAEIRAWVENRIDIDSRKEEVVVEFDATGISLAGPEGTRRFPATPGIPEIFLPVMGVYDPGSRMVYCITYGAEGYLYAVDTRTGQWQVLTGLNEYDAAWLLFDADSRQLITTGAFSRPGEIKVIGLDGSDTSVFVPTTAFPGLTDLFDYGNEHGPPLIPRVFRDGWLLLEVVSRREGASPNTGPYRVYAVRIETGEVRLLGIGSD